MLVGFGAARAGDLGSPPSGTIPILYNNHTVYAKPDVLKQGRVLAAFLKNQQIYVPLRSMFERMGAVVTASADGLTFTATKPGVTVSVRLGSSVVTINGEERPLDVPPILYHGVVLVPVRVLSEALGAYVQWVPDQRVVVVRYIPPTPAPIAPPTAAPTAAPTIAPPVPTPAPAIYPAFVEAAFAAPRTYNEFSAGQFCARSFNVVGVYAFPGSRFAVKVDYRQDVYVTSDNLVNGYGNHYTRFATIDGGTALTPVFLARQNTLDGRLEYRVAPSQIYVGVGYLTTGDNYGYPQLNGFGAGVEKLPEMRPGISIYGSAFYYPSASGNYTIANAASPNNGATYKQQYQIAKYDIGLSLVLRHSPVYLYGGFNDDQYVAKQNAPIGQTHAGPYIGLGVKL